MCVQRSLDISGSMNFPKASNRSVDSLNKLGFSIMLRHLFYFF